MPLPEAIAAVKQALTGWEIADTPDTTTFGQRATAAVYRAGTTINIHGEKAHDVAVLFSVPMAMEFVSGADVERVQQAAEDLLDWLAANGRDVGGMLVYWPEPPVAGELTLSDRAEISVGFTVCERYPRSA